MDRETAECFSDASCQFYGLPSSHFEFHISAESAVCIQCHMCKRWYHAICVGFDPMDPREGFWYCPTCTTELDDVDADVDADEVYPKASHQPHNSQESYDSWHLLMSPKSQVLHSVAAKVATLIGQSGANMVSLRNAWALPDSGQGALTGIDHKSELTSHNESKGSKVGQEESRLVDLHGDVSEVEKKGKKRESSDLL